MAGLWEAAVAAAAAAVVCHLYCSRGGGPPPFPPMSGHWHPHFSEVAQIFRRQVESGVEPGGAFSVYHQGELLVDLWGGWADRGAEREWRSDTLTMVYSVSKGVAAILAAKMVDRGWLDYDKPVAHYWPEFHLKNITVGMLLSHQGGLICLDTPISLLDLVNNRTAVEKLVARQQPVIPPGRGVGYHTLTYGLFVDTLLQKAHPQKKSISEIFEEEIGEPFGLEFHFGAGLGTRARLARLESWSGLLSLLQVLADPVQRPMMLSAITNPLFRRSLNTFGEGAFKLSTFNNPDVQAVGLSSFLGFSSARDLAKLYSVLANGGSSQGKQLMRPETVHQLVKPVVEAKDQVLGVNTKRSHGLFLDVTRTATAGHQGFGGQTAFADFRYKVGVAYVTNHLGDFPITDPRYAQLEDALYRALATFDGS